MNKLSARRTKIPMVEATGPADGSSQTDARRRDMEQIAAISAFEGMKPTPDYERIRSRYVSGEISAQEFKQLILDRWKRYG